MSAPKTVSSTSAAISAPAGLASLSGGEIHVWRMDLACESVADTGLFLTEADRQRAARFAFRRDRNRYLRARHALRQILGGYLGVDPQRLPIVLGPHDKPGLAAGNDLGFNLSHSGDRGILAVGRAREIGIDIEDAILPAGARRVAESVFSPAEMRALDCVADDRLSMPFFTCWTRKEAVLKAIGTGFVADPRSVNVGIEPARSRIRVDARRRNDLVDVESIALDAGGVASLAVVGGFSTARFIDYRPAGRLEFMRSIEDWTGYIVRLSRPRAGEAQH